MALDYGTAYSVTGTDQTDGDYPGGKGVNASSLTAKDGFPAKANRSNDLLGFLQWLITFGSRGRITNRTQYLAEISGSPDSIAASDYGDGLQAIIDPIDPAILDYSELTNYVFGDLVKSFGSQYLCLVANGPATSVVNPVEDVNGDNWIELPGEKWCRGKAQVIEPFYTGVKPIFDYNDGTYQMVFPYGQYRKGNFIFKYFMVIHDDSNVIGVGNIAHNAMAQGTKGANIATLVGSDYTMFDGKDCTISAQGNNRPATFGRQEDQFQSSISYSGAQIVSGSTLDDCSIYGNTQVTDDIPGDATREFNIGTSLSTTGGAYRNSTPKDDGVNGTPRTGSDTHMQNLQGGALAQIVCEVVAV